MQRLPLHRGEACRLFLNVESLNVKLLCRPGECVGGALSDDVGAAHTLTVVFGNLHGGLQPVKLIYVVGAFLFSVV